MPAPVPQLGELIAGKYRVESVLGRGGMGVVFAARHTISERRVAVKWMEADEQDGPDALERFVREARAMGRIEHPNVVGVLDVGTDRDVAYLVMEVLRGESLRALMSRESRLPAEKALATLLPALEGVEAAHRAGVVHRDLKPENLFVVRGAGGEPITTKVLDFGISKLAESDAKKREARRLTKTGHVVGTPTYMSPEQVRGTAFDARTDVWSLAIILYEMLSGTTPFEGDNYGALLVAIAVEPYAPLDPTVVAPNLARVIHKGLAKEPEERWQSVLDFARALEPFARGAKFHEPVRPSIAPEAPEARRVSAVPTLEQRGRPTTPDDPASAEVPPLATPAPRTPPGRTAATSPTPIRIQRSAPIDAGPTPAAVSPNRRVVAIAALAFALLVGLVLVIRGIGRAARDAMLLPATSPTAEPVVEAPPSQVGTVTTPLPDVPAASDLPEAPPPEATTAPVADAPTARPHRTESSARTRALGATPTTAEATPPPSTTTSRSGSIRREDF